MPPMLLNREFCEGLVGDITLSNNPHSDLTYSGSASSKKRAYMALSQQNNLQLNSMMYESGGATTSGRPDTSSTPATAGPLFCGEFVSRLDNQSLDSDSLVHFQMERLKSGMEILRRNYCRKLQSVVEQELVKSLRAKDVELETIKQRNKELEEQLMRTSAECQVWFNYANTTETVVADLKEKLNDVFANQNICPTIDVEEGYGYCGRDAESVCETNEETELQGRTACRVCREREVCVLLLPCRHLCLCKDCEARIDTCPICDSTRNASIQVIVP